MSAEIGLQHNPDGPEWDDDYQLHERIDDLLAQFKRDPAKIAEADAWNDGMQDGDHYTAVEVALANLGEVSTDRLMGSDALATVLRLAKVHAEARKNKLRAMAEDAANREREDA